MRRQWVPGLFFSRAYAHAREKRPGDEARAKGTSLSRVANFHFAEIVGSIVGVANYSQFNCIDFEQLWILR